MFKNVFWFKHIVIGLQILALSFYSSVGHTQSPNPNQNSNELPVQQLFLSTESVPTNKGDAHIEVQSFEINNQQDLAQAKAEILEKLGQDNKSEDLFVLEVQSKEYKSNSLEQTTRLSLNEIENSLDVKNKIKPQALITESPNKVNFLKKHYNITLGFVRFVANTATVSTGLIIGKGVSPEHALLVGTLAGALSGIIQVKSDALFKWLSNSVLLVKAAQKSGLLSKNETGFTRATEKTLKEVEMYGRWASLEAGFLLICQTAMTILNIPIAENLLLTVAKSTASQGVFEVGVLKATNELEKINPRWTTKAAVFKNVSLFAGSSISVLAAIGSMIDMPFANLGFVVLTATGVVLNFSSKIVKLKTLDRIFQKWRQPTLPRILFCKNLFQLI